MLPHHNAGKTGHGALKGCAGGADRCPEGGHQALERLRFQGLQLASVFSEREVRPR